MTRRRDHGFPCLAEGETFCFPDPGTADENGIVAVGGNLSPGMLLSAYRQGIFPWFSDDEPILWWSPDPRCVLYPEDLHVSGTMRKVLRQGRFSLTVDSAFPETIARCASKSREGQSGTWITPDMVCAYTELHRLGWAHSCEAWVDGRLCGGLYGLSLGRMFFGESMFHDEDNASRAAFLSLALCLFDKGIALVDSQVPTDNMNFLGARVIPRQDYLRELASLVSGPSLKGDWKEMFPDFPVSESWNALMGARGGQK